MRLVATAAAEKKAQDLVILDVRGRVSYADWFVLCSGGNARQVRAVAEAIVGALKEEVGRGPLGVEGLRSAKWVLVDGADLVAHVFERTQREYYDLEGLWVDAPRVDIAELGIDLPSESEDGPWLPPATVPPIPR